MSNPNILDIDVYKWKMNKSFRDEVKKFGQEKGGVVTRFPPAPNGYLHIGHAKALFINYVVAVIGQGKMLIRIDDTNPSSDDETYTNAILDDINELLKDKLHLFELSYTSDHFAR